MASAPPASGHDASTPHAGSGDAAQAYVVATSRTHGGNSERTERVPFTDETTVGDITEFLRLAWGVPAVRLYVGDAPLDAADNLRTAVNAVSGVEVTAGNLDVEAVIEQCGE